MAFYCPADKEAKRFGVGKLQICRSVRLTDTADQQRASVSRSTPNGRNAYTQF